MIWCLLTLQGVYLDYHLLDGLSKVLPNIKRFGFKLHSNCSSYLKLTVSVCDRFPSRTPMRPRARACTPAHSHAEGVPSKSDISLHSGIKALCTRADTWSLSLCQRGLASGLRCLEELGEFTPPTSCSTQNHTQATGSPGKDTRLCPKLRQSKILPYIVRAQTHTVLWALQRTHACWSKCQTEHTLLLW